MSKAQSTLGSNRLFQSPLKDITSALEQKKDKPTHPMTPQKQLNKQKNQFFDQRICKTDQYKKFLSFDFNFPTKIMSKKNLLSTYLDSKESKYTGCNCRKSQCLKMYCTCFAEGKMCDQTCLCDSCKNDHDNMDRSQAINQIIEKDPYAFSKKQEITNANLQFQDDFCNCKKSNCAKKYCDCYRRGKSCNEKCNCTECNNHQGCNNSENDDVQGQKPKKKIKENE